MTYQDTWSPKFEQHQDAKLHYKEEAIRFLNAVRPAPTGRVLEAKPKALN